MTLILEVLFFSGLGLIIYTYLGYPFLLSLKNKKSFEVDNSYEPSVSFIIAAFNEEKGIQSKLENTLTLDYPKEKLEIIVASDGSTDRTVQIAEGIEGVKVMSLERRGKTSAQNSASKEAFGEILVFSDANGYYSTNALRKLVRNFADPKVGSVCGELRYKGGNAEGMYWRYEVMIKKLESRMGKLLGANGCIYAVRKSDYVELPDYVISDFVEPLKVYEQGKNVIYEEEAIAWEDNPPETLKRKRRIILRSLQSLNYLSNLLNPVRSRKLFWQLVSHKILRWFISFILIIIFISNVILLSEGTFYQLMMFAQVMSYLSATVNQTVRYLLVVNAASFLGIFDWLRGKRIITWTIDR